MYDLGIKTSQLITDSGESAIIDSLNSDDSYKLLSANQGKILNDKIAVLTGTGKGSIHQIVKDSLESIEEITWNNKFNINDYTKSGVYVITGNRLSNKDNLPILNFGENVSFSAKLFVTESPEGTTTYRSIIGQILFLSNAEGHETKIYTRSATKTIPEGGSKYKVTWGDWQVMQGMKEVGVVNSYDSFIDNGMYSGIYNYNNTIETFVLITINDYAVKNQLGVPKSVSQLKYAVNALNNKSELSVRVGGGQTFKWGEWKPIFDVESITTQINNIQNQLNELTEGSLATLNMRVYELGDFLTTGDAERKAAEETISKNPSISIIHYTVNGTTSHIIIQDVNEDFTQQVLYYGGHTYIRHIGANLNASWRKTNPTNIKYNQDNHRIALMHMVNQYGEGDNNIDWVELPTASDRTDGLMTKEQVKSLEGKQDKITKYFESDSSAGVSFTKDSTTHSSVQVSPSQALMYYKQGNHIDRIVASETEHINITSSDENGSNVSQVLVKPDEINLRDGNGKGYINIKSNSTVISSKQSETGLRSMVQATDERLQLIHYPEVKEGVESGGIGIVIDDNKIAFYSELNGYISPLMITKAGEIFIPNVCNDLATYIKSLEARIAKLEANLSIVN